MDLPPTIPTSFVPRPTSVITRRFRSDLTGTFALFSYAVLGIVSVLALGVFFYDRILAGAQESRNAALAKAQKAIDVATVESFVQLRDRLTFGARLLENHVAFSGFFKLVEKIMPTSVRFTSLHLVLDEAKKVRLEGSGTAKSFNALAAVSIAFATDGRIKDAIFSDIVVNKNSTVSFALSATLDPKIVAFSP